MASEIGKACRIFRFGSQPVKDDIRRSMLENSGEYFGSYSPLILEGVSGLSLALKRKNAKRILKGFLKIAAGGIIDPFSGFRKETKEISRGKIFRLP